MPPEVTPAPGTPEQPVTPAETLRQLKALQEKIRTFNPNAARPNIDAAKDDRAAKDKLFLQGQYTFKDGVDVHIDIVKTQVQLMMVNKEQWESFYESAALQRARMNVFLKDWKEHPEDPTLKPLYNKAVNAILYYLKNDTIQKNVPAKLTDEQLTDAAYMLQYSEILKKHMDEYDQYRGNFASYRGVFAEKSDKIVKEGTGAPEWNAFVDEANVTSQRYEEFKKKNPDASKDNAYIRLMRKKLVDAQKKYADHYDNMKTDADAMTECQVAFKLMEEQLDRFAFYEIFVQKNPEMLPDIVKMAEMEEKGITITPENVAAIMQQEPDGAPAQAETPRTAAAPAAKPASGDVAVATPSVTPRASTPELRTPDAVATPPVQAPAAAILAPEARTQDVERTASAQPPIGMEPQKPDLARATPSVGMPELKRVTPEETAPASTVERKPLPRSASVATTQIPDADLRVPDAAAVAATAEVPTIPSAVSETPKTDIDPEDRIETVVFRKRKFRVSFAHHKLKEFAPDEPAAEVKTENQPVPPKSPEPARAQPQQSPRNSAYSAPRFPLLQRLRARFRR